MIEVDSLTKNYGSVQAIQDVSFKISRGEVVGFLGPNGAGKTTTMKILTTFLQPTSGTARVAGFDILDEPLEVRRRIGYLPEDAPLYDDMLVSEALAFVAEVRKIPPTDRADRIGEVVARCGLEPVYGRPVGHLSKGFRQRVGFGQAMIHQPEILILDEPTSGLDPNQVVEIRELIREIGREKTVILSTHILREVEVTCNRVLIIHQGRIVADAPAEDLHKGDTVVTKIKGPADEVAAALEKVDGVREAVREEIPGEYHRFRLKIDGDGDPCPAVFDVAAKNGWTLAELRTEAASLEEVFWELTRT